MSQFSQGMKSVFKGFRMINQYRLWHYLVLPMVITITLAYILRFSLSAFGSDYLLEELRRQFPQLETIPFVSTLFSIMKIFISIAFYFLFSFIMVIFYNIIGNVVWSFFIGSLQEEIEFKMSGKEIRYPLIRNIKWILISIWDSVKDILLILIAYLFSLILFFIPFLGALIQLVLIIFLNSYIMGRVIFRMSLENHSHTLSERNKILRRHFKGNALGIGFLAVISSYFPLIGIFLFFVFWTGGMVGSIDLIYQKLNPKATENK
ncbi:MAG TPA: hypothetical protein DHW82_03000 [Spirochaetia bacterium]|nr:MAG: hypothetical protein A2Y41_03625 [Spirochaetes bacterium GWB1_36_13]HCL55959.1 hypothetical protein [Spirochaetia bacterium]